MAQRFQQACRNEHWNLVRLEAEKPRGLGCVESGRGNLPAQKFSLLSEFVHTDYEYHRSSVGRCIKYTRQLMHYGWKTHEIPANRSDKPVVGS